MTVNSLTASFGKLDNETITFHDGLNVIYAPNESGKSTWCAFIRAMLFGIDSSERQKGGALPDRKKYAPWDGNPMEGTMEITSGHSDITLTRRTLSANAPMRDFSAVYTGTAIPVEGLTGTNAGLELTGVSAEVFKRSAFVGQGKADATGGAELEKRINSLLSSGEEDISFAEASSRLGNWQRKRRFNSKGALPKLEAQLAEEEQQLERMNGICRDIEALEQQHEENISECEKLEARAADERGLQRKKVLSELAEARAETKAASAEHDEALRRLNGCRDALRKSVFGEMGINAADAAAEADSAELERLGAETGKKKSPLLFIFCFIAALACAAVYEKIIDHWALIAAAGLFCAAAIWLMAIYMKNRRAVLAARSEAKLIFDKYDISAADGLADRLEEYHSLFSAVKKALERELEAKNRADAAEDRLFSLENRMTEELDFTSGPSEAARLGRELALRRKEGTEIAGRLSQKRGELSALGDPAAVRDGILTLRSEIMEIESEYEAIGLASEVLGEADAELSARYTPELGKIAGEYMAFITDGKYENVFLNRDFSAMTKTHDDTVAREPGYLSAGTYDLLYLTVRLAVCELALPEGEACPLIIDDALVNLDETRYAQAMRLLEEIAKTRQVIVFTCRLK